SSTVNRSTRPGWRCSPTTRAPTSAVNSAVARPSGLSQGRSRIVAHSLVTGFFQTSPTPIAVRSGGHRGSGCDITNDPPLFVGRSYPFRPLRRESLRVRSNVAVQWRRYGTQPGNWLATFADFLDALLAIGFAPIQSALSVALQG